LKVLPAGSAFPFDFGFVPGTNAEDGDPIDVLVLMDEPTFTGCLIRCRLIGVLVATQTEHGKTVRNDRLVAVAKNAQNYHDLRSLRDVNKNLLKELAHFFASYNQMKAKIFELVGVKGLAFARKLVITSAGQVGGNVSKRKK
jgi:inorganic pyrophosphatase